MDYLGKLEGGNPGGEGEAAVNTVPDGSSRARQVNWPVTGMAPGRVVSLQIKLQRGKMEPRDIVVAEPEGGLRDDFHANSVGRQILLIDTQTLDDFGHEPGQIREQITLDMPNLQTLPAGTRLAIGEAVLEVGKSCTPCEHMARLVGGADPQGWLERIRGQRGVFARTVTPGAIRVGDTVIVLNEEGAVRG
ncbi:MAG: hypothetical protein AMXMBFR61_21520 [Fimbriimonadales bacterium]